MKEIILTVGAPGSGKTTWAEDYVRKNCGYINLNRDDFRESLLSWNRGQKRLTKHQEKLVTVAQQAAAIDLLKQGHVKGIIISDTNLNPKTVNKWKEIAKNEKVNYREEHFMCSYEELVRRNLHRGSHAVPAPVLREFHQKHYEQSGGYVYHPQLMKPKAIIYDMDGTAAIHNGRSPYDLDKLSTDLPNEMVIQHMHAMAAAGFKIIVMSGRESGTKEDTTKHYKATEQWLIDNNAPYDKLFMREQGDHRPDHVVKLQLFISKVAQEYNVLLAVDDRNQVVDLWRRIGLQCWQVNYGDF